MKKNFFKKLSVVLALALTVSAVAPAAATEASAAAAPAFKSKSVTVEAGKTKNYGMNNVTAYSVVKFVTGNKKVATVKKSGKTAKVTGVAEGKTTLRADLKAYKSKKELQVRMPVTVTSAEKGLVKVTQTAINKLELTFGAEESLKDLTKEDVTIIRSGDNQKMYVREVKSDGKVLKVETILDMTDRNVFSVTVGERTLQFTATDGIVVDLKLNTTQIQFDKATMIQLISTDAAGVELKSINYNSSVTNYDFTIDTTEGYIDNDNKLVLNEVGNTAKVKGVYHTYKFNDNGEEIGKIEKEFTVVAVAKAVVGSYEKYTIASSNPSDWGTATVNHELIINDKTSDTRFWMLAKDSVGDNAVNGDPTSWNYTVHSSNEDIFFVSGTNTLIGNKVGSAYVVIKDLDGKTIWTMPVTVKAEAKAKTLEVSTSNVSVTNSILAAAKVNVGLKAKDTYGREVSVGSEYVVTCLSAPTTTIKNNVNATLSDYVKTNSASIDFYGTLAGGTSTAITAGTYTYQVKLTKDNANFIRVVTVNVQQPNMSITSTYRLVIEGVAGAYTYDTAITSNNKDDKNISIQLGEYKNNVLYQYVDLVGDAIKSFKQSDGTSAMSNLTSGAAANTKHATFAAMSVTQVGGADSTIYEVSKVKATTYTIEVEDPANALRTIKQNIIIKDSTPAVTFTKRAEVDATLIAASDLTTAAMNVYRFKVGSTSLDVKDIENAADGSVITVADYARKINKTNAVPSGSNTKTYVKSIDLFVPIMVDGNKYRVPVNMSIENYVEHGL